MANSVDPDQLASWKPTDLDLHCLQRQGISGFSRTRVNHTFLKNLANPLDYLIMCLKCTDRMVYRVKWSTELN